MRNENTHNDDALNVLLKSWQAPAPSPWLETRVAQRLIQDARAQGLVWPFSMPKLAGMATAAVLLGGVLGANLPPNMAPNMTIDAGFDDAAQEMTAEAEVADTVDVSTVIAADTEMLEGLW